MVGMFHSQEEAWILRFFDMFRSNVHAFEVKRSCFSSSVNNVRRQNRGLYRRNNGTRCSAIPVQRSGAIAILRNLSLSLSRVQVLSKFT